MSTKNPPKPSPAIGDELGRWRSYLVPYFVWVMTIALVMVMVCLGFTFMIVRDPPPYASKSVQDVVVLVTVFQIALGMVMGLTCLAIGVAMCWVGIEVPFKLQLGEGHVTPSLLLQSMSPGIILLLGGMMLMYFSLYMPMELSPKDGFNKREREHSSYGAEDLSVGDGGTQRKGIGKIPEAEQSDNPKSDQGGGSKREFVPQD